MSPVLAGILISLGVLLCAALVASGGALWRLGTKVGAFEAAVTAANNAAREAKKASLEAQAAAQRAAADAVAAARVLYEAMETTVHGVQGKLEEVRCELAEARGHWLESHDMAEKVNDHEKRLYNLEREHERNHGMLPMAPEQSARHYLPVPPAPDEDAIVEGLFDDDKGKRGG